MAQNAQTRQKQFNAKGGLGLQGYDPLSYHVRGPKKRDSKVSFKHEGITYRFASDANRKKFQDNPSKYEPACGGWCAWAMLEGDKVKVDPKSYKVISGKTHLFYNGFLGDTHKKWTAKKDDQGQAAKVASQWHKFVGS